MTTDILLRELVSEGANELAAPARGSRQFQYWRNCEREDCNRHKKQQGWLMLGPAFQPNTATEYVEFIRNKHATPLDAYGTSSDNSMAVGPNRFDMMLKKGGIKDFPIEQLIAYGWHRSKTILDSRADLAKAVKDLHEYSCEHGCPTTGVSAKIFSTIEDYKTHEKVMHPEASAPAAVGRAIASTLQREGASNGADIASIVTAVIAGLKSEGMLK